MDFTKPPTDKDIRGFAYVMTAFFALVGSYLLYHQYLSYIYFFGVAGGFLGLGLIVPTLLTPLYRGWMALAMVLNWIATGLLLGILFYLILTPISLAMRLGGKKFLQFDLDEDQESYWNERTEEQKSYPRERYEKQF